MNGIEEKIRSYIISNFLFGDGSRLQTQSSFIEEGIIDSTGILELVHFLEEEFGLAIEDDEIVPENLDSISRVSAFVRRRKYPTYVELELPAMMRAGA